MRIHTKTLLWLCATVLSFSLIIYGCRKTSDTEQTPEEQIADQQNTIDKFLKLPSSAIPLSQKIVANLRRQNNVNLFIPAFAKRYGFPLWDKATKHPTPKKRGVNNTGNREGDVTDEQVLVPLVREGSEVVYSALACRIIGDSVTVRLLDAQDYAAFNRDSVTSGINGRQLSLMLMNLNKEVYGYDRFIVKDSAAFGGLGKNVKEVKINSSSNTAGRLILWEETICVTISYTCPGLAFRAQGNNTRVNGRMCHENFCETYYYYEDDGTGGGGGGGGTGSGGGGDGDGTGNPNNPCGPSGGRLIANGRIAPPCGGGGGGGTGGGGSNNPPPVWEPWIEDNIPFIQLDTIKNRLVNACLKNATDKVANYNLKNYLMKLYKSNFASSHINILFQEDPNLEDTSGNPQLAASYGVNNTWVVLLNPKIVDGTHHDSISIEYVGTAILHEIVHSFLIIYKDSLGLTSLTEFSTHAAMFNGFVLHTRDALMQAFPNLTSQEATALALDGIDDVLNKEYTPDGYTLLGYDMKFDSIANANYGMHIPTADSITSLFFRAAKGTRCQ